MHPAAPAATPLDFTGTKFSTGTAIFRDDRVLDWIGTRKYLRVL